MQRYTIFFINVNAVHVSGGFSAHHQELKNCTHSIGCMSSLLAATASGISYNVASCWLYLKNTLTMHGHMNANMCVRIYIYIYMCYFVCLFVYM